MGKKNNHKFTLKQFIWNGFNLTVAVAFLGSLRLLADKQGDGLGLNMIWIFVLMSFIVGICAFAFAKLSRYYKQDSNGGAYIYTRGAFGKFIGFVVGILNYIIIPLVFCNQILMFIKANFDPGMSGTNQYYIDTHQLAPATGNSQWWNSWVGSLGHWSNLFYDGIGILLCVGFACFAFFGSKMYKKAGKYTLLIKWVTSAFFILFAVVSACLPSNKENASSWSHNSTLTFSGFASAFSACFYYFTGFEVFATAGENLEEPEKNLSKGIIWVIVLSGVFYVGLTTIYLLAVGPGSLTQNINTGFWLRLKDAKGLYWLLYAGPLIMIICTIFMRGNTVAQLSLYGGTTLQPLSKEGYISSNFAKLNDNLFPANAMKLNVIVVAITISIWQVIPDIINGATGGKADFINVNTIISAASAFYILLYLIVLLAALKYAFTNVIKIGAFERICYLLAVLCLGVVFCYHYYDLISSAKDITSYVALGVEFTFIFGLILFVIFVYFSYYKPKLAKRLSENKKTQDDLDHEFRLMDGWAYFKGRFGYMFDGYIKRERQRNKLAKHFAKFIKVNKDNQDAKLNWRKRLFIEKMEKNIMWDYLTYSQHVDHYNESHNINTKDDISANNKQAREMFAREKERILNFK